MTRRSSSRTARCSAGRHLHQSRHYSLYLALQLKARHAGIPTPVYGLQEVHHRS
ncbi:hypothetical protein ACFSHS_05855 [Blastococcus deserti]|uniref:Uncharacterized protein n=1 Tax=Blastococcus deserti TaxID=2259033 RepID=A0ABW4X6Q1_9ACTN